MKHAEVTRTHRFLAMLLSVAMMLTMFAWPASAQEDWKELVITLSWPSGDGVASVTAAPVEWSDDQSFWAQVDAQAPLNALTITMAHPNHAYVFNPASGTVLSYVVDAGDGTDPLTAQVIMADDQGIPETFHLYISTMPVPMDPPQPTPDPSYSVAGSVLRFGKTTTSLVVRSAPIQADNQVTMLRGDTNVWIVEEVVNSVGEKWMHVTIEGRDAFIRSDFLTVLSQKESDSVMASMMQQGATVIPGANTPVPTNAPTSAPTDAPTQAPTDAPTQRPTDAPTQAPAPDASYVPGATINLFGRTNMALNVRSQPIQGDNKVTTLPEGANIWIVQEVTNSNGESWMRAILDGREVFVMSQFMTLLSQEESNRIMGSMMQGGATVIPGASTPAPTNPPAQPPTNAPTSAPTDVPTNAPTNAPTSKPEPDGSYIVLRAMNLFGRTNASLNVRSAPVQGDNKVATLAEGANLWLMEEVQNRSGESWFHGLLDEAKETPNPVPFHLSESLERIADSITHDKGERSAIQTALHQYKCYGKGR